MTAGSGAVRPLVSVVTPSFNQARYLRATIDSVLAQDYPHLEYVVIDGGSTDGSLDVLASYGDRVTWTSEADRGQADAINKGFQGTKGTILGWLNADDVYAPGAVSTVVRTFEAHPEVGLVYGRGNIIDANGDIVGPFEEIEPYSLWRLLYGLDYILQPAAFFRRGHTGAVDWLDENLDYALDWDLWLKLATSTEVRYVEQSLASSRVHDTAKTSTGGWPRIRELGRVARSHTGSFWTPGVRLYAVDTLARQLKNWCGLGMHRPIEALERRAAWHISKRVALQTDGWLSPRGRLAVPTRWRHAIVVLEAHRLPHDGRMTVTISSAGHPLAEAVIDQLGRFEMRIDLPVTERPFIELDVACNFSFVDATGRRLTLRCVDLTPAEVGS